MVKITATTLKQTVFTVLTGTNYYPVNITAIISETNPALTRVGASLDWNDGTPPVSLTPGSTITVNATRNLSLGTYYIALTAYNYAQPKPEQVSYYFTVQVQPQQIAAIPQDYLFGPILPLDNTFPNEQEWNFNVSTNLNVLASSVKMLLITTKGERVMQPTYGTLLRKVIFDLSTPALTTIIEQEIKDAITQFEPRVSLDSISVQRQDAGGRSLLVNATFLSKISQSTFSLSLPFTA